MTNEELIAWAVGRPNQFTDSVVPNGFFDVPDDVPEIHAEQRARLRALVAQSRSSARPRLQLVLGGPGGGKTHLLARLRAESTQSWSRPSEEHALVPVRPLGDASAPFAHLLREVVSGLHRPFQRAQPGVDELASPLEHVLWRGLRAAWLALRRQHPEAPELASLAHFDMPRMPSVFVSQARAQWEQLERHFVEDAPRLDPVAGFDSEVWSVLCRYPRPGLDVLVTRWLRGDALGEDDLRKLGVGRPIDSEDRALRALGTLLSLSDVPVVLGLDQLEGVRRHGPDAVDALFRALSDLYTQGGRWVVVIFCQTQEWAEIQTTLQRQIRERFEPEDLLLRNLTPALGEKLVVRRLEGLWRGLGITPPHPSFPYREGFVRSELTRLALYEPRRILAHFAALGLQPTPSARTPPPPPPPLEIARRAYHRRREDLRQAGADESTAPEETQRALADALGQAIGRELAGVRLVEVAHEPLRKGGNKKGLHARLAREGREMRLYVEASNESHGPAAAATAKRLVEATKGLADKAIWIRSPLVPLTKSARETLDALGEKAALLPLVPEDVLSLAAIEGLLDAIASRDVDLTPEVAGQLLLDEILPELAVVRALASAAFSAPSATAGATNAASALLAQLAQPPHVATLGQLARRAGLTLAAVTSAAETLERAGAVRVLSGSDGARVALRRPA